MSSVFKSLKFVNFCLDLLQVLTFVFLFFASRTSPITQGCPCQYVSIFSVPSIQEAYYRQRQTQEAGCALVLFCYFSFSLLSSHLSATSCSPGSPKVPLLDGTRKKAGNGHKAFPLHPLCLHIVYALLLSFVRGKHNNG